MSATASTVEYAMEEEEGEERRMETSSSSSHSPSPLPLEGMKVLETGEGEEGGTDEGALPLTLEGAE